MGVVRMCVGECFALLRAGEFFAASGRGDAAKLAELCAPSLQPQLAAVAAARATVREEAPMHVCTKTLTVFAEADTAGGTLHSLKFDEDGLVVCYRAFTQSASGP